MPCPYCGSYATTTVTPEGGRWYEYCNACGTTIQDDDSGDYDICEMEGHDWQEVELGGETCDECRRCGAIDC